MIPDGDVSGVKGIFTQDRYQVRQGALLPAVDVRIDGRKLRVLLPVKQRLVQGAGHKELVCAGRKKLPLASPKELQVLDRQTAFCSSPPALSGSVGGISVVSVRTDNALSSVPSAQNCFAPA